MQSSDVTLGRTLLLYQHSFLFLCVFLSQKFWQHHIFSNQITYIPTATALLFCPIGCLYLLPTTVNISSSPGGDMGDEALWEGGKQLHSISRCSASPCPSKCLPVTSQAGNSATCSGTRERTQPVCKHQWCSTANMGMHQTAKGATRGDVRGLERDNIPFHGYTSLIFCYSSPVLRWWASSKHRRSDGREWACTRKSPCTPLEGWLSFPGSLCRPLQQALPAPCPIHPPPSQLLHYLMHLFPPKAHLFTLLPQLTLSHCLWCSQPSSTHPRPQVKAAGQRQSTHTPFLPNSPENKDFTDCYNKHYS